MAVDTTDYPSWATPPKYSAEQAIMGGVTGFLGGLAYANPFMMVAGFLIGGTTALLASADPNLQMLAESYRERLDKWTSGGFGLSEREVSGILAGVRAPSLAGGAGWQREKMAASGPAGYNAGVTAQRMDAAKEAQAEAVAQVSQRLGAVDRERMKYESAVTEKIRADLMAAQGLRSAATQRGAAGVLGAIPGAAKGASAIAAEGGDFLNKDAIQAAQKKLTAAPIYNVVAPVNPASPYPVGSNYQTPGQRVDLLTGEPLDEEVLV